MKSLFAAICSVFLLVTTPGSANEQFPVNNVKIIVPFPAGGTTDILARFVAQYLGEKLGVTTIVENRAGASGIIGSEVVAKSPNDGSVLLLTATHHVINPSLYKQLPFDPRKEFSPVALVASAPNALVVTANFPAKNVGELIAMAKKEPGKYSFGSAGIGGANHLSGELFKQMAGVDIVRVNYKGTGPAINDVIAGQVQMVFGTAPAVMPHVKSGRLKALAVTSLEPSPLAPGLPTVAASGVPGYESGGIYFTMAPARTPAAIVRRLNGDIVRVLDQPEVKQRFLSAGIESGSSTPAELAATVKSDNAKWGAVIKKAGIHQ